MNETTLVKGISAIGSMDGPTSVFLAGKLSVGVFAAVIAIGILIGISDWSRSGSWNLCISGN